MSKYDKIKPALPTPATAPGHRPARPSWQTPMGRVTRNPRPGGRAITVPRRPGHR